jgi:hypothetical protein
MKTVPKLLLTISAVISLGLPQTAAAQYIVEADRYTVRRLQRDLLSGNEFYYPTEAVKLKMDGVGRFAMGPVFSPVRFLLPNSRIQMW